MTGSAAGPHDVARHLPSEWTHEQLLIDLWAALKDAAPTQLEAVRRQISSERAKELDGLWTHYTAGAFLTLFFAVTDDLDKPTNKLIWRRLECRRGVAKGEVDVLREIRNAAVHNADDLKRNRRDDAYEIVTRFAKSISHGNVMIEGELGLHVLDSYFELHRSRVVLTNQFFNRAYEVLHAFCEEAGWSINDPNAKGELIR